MGKPLEISALKLAGELARAFASVPSNKIGNNRIDPDNPERINEIHKTTLRFLFIFMLILHMEESNQLPDSSEYRANYSIFNIREKLSLSKKEFGSRKLKIIKRIRETVPLIHDGTNENAPFRARLFDPSNLENRNIFKWKFYDSDIYASLNEMFRLWPHPMTSLLATALPDTRQIIDIYSYLLDFELLRAKAPMIILNGGEKTISVSDASPSELHRGIPLEKGQVYYKHTKDKARKSGAVYTPDNIVNKIVETVLNPIFEEKSNESPIRIIDPSCGTGRFLEGAFKFLTNQHLENGLDTSNKEINRKIITESLFGVDNDILAIELAEANLMLKMHNIQNPAPSLTNNLIFADTLTGIDSGIFLRQLQQRNEEPYKSDEQPTLEETKLQPIWKKIINTDPPSKESQILFSLFDSMSRNLLLEKNNDQIEYQYSLLINKPDDIKINVKSHGQAQIRPFHPELHFPFLYYDRDGLPLEKQGFDAVIGNPPYGDILPSETKDLLLKLEYASGGSGNNDIFRFFVEKGLNLLRQGGMLGFILPNTYLKGKKYRNFRERILDLSIPVEIIDFDLAKIFQRDVFTSLLFLKKKPYKKLPPIFVTSLDGTLENVKIEKLDIENIRESSWIPSGELYKKIISDKRFVPLDPFIARIGDVGINYQRKDVGWQSRAPSRIASEIFYEGEKEHPDDLPYLKGEDIERFIVNPKAKRWLRHDWKDRINNGETVSVNLAWAQKPSKILTRQTGDSIVAAIDKSGYLTGRSLHTTILKDTRYSPYYILALLNSDLMNRIYLELTREKGRAQAQVKLSFLRKLPIRTISFDMNEKLRDEIVKSEMQKIGDDFSLLPDVTNDLMKRAYEAAAHDVVSFAAINNNNRNNEKQSWLNKSVYLLYSQL